MRKFEVYDTATRSPDLVRELVELIRYRDLVIQLVIRSIKTRYKRSILGVGWTMLNPLLTMVVLTIIFSNIFRFTVENYPLYILSGLLLWNFFSQTTTAAMTEMLWGGSLFQRIYVPKAIFAFAALGTSIVNLVLSIGPLLFIMLLLGVRIRPAILFLPISILLVSAFTLGVSLILSRVAAFFADMLPVYGVILTIWMYMTPIIYPQEIVPDSLRWMLRVNPVLYFVDTFRKPIYYGTLPEIQTVFIAVVSGLAMLAIGWWFFTRKANEYAYRL